MDFFPDDLTAEKIKSKMNNSLWLKKVRKFIYDAILKDGYYDDGLKYISYDVIALKQELRILKDELEARGFTVKIGEISYEDSPMYCHLSVYTVDINN